jgi:hypothetical protein
MALSELHRAQISRRLKALCDRRVPAHARSQVRLDFRLGTSDVVLFESRPAFKAPHEWRDHDIARFRFVAAANEWRLFCQFRDLKWRAYQPLPSAPDFETLLREVDRDPTGIFWG